MYQSDTSCPAAVKLRGNDFLSCGPGELPAAHYMEMQMMYALSGAFAAVAYNSESVLHFKLL